MHIDARALEDGSTIEGDLCIVGAGAAGITIALDWIGDKRKVLLLEGGGFEYEPAMQDLYRGENVGLPYFPLEAARLHYFGGTTGHWAGFCSTFDDLDFETRDWVPDSGWPIAKAAVEPHLPRAMQLLELGPNEWDAEQWERRDAAMKRLPLDPKVAWTKMWQFSRPTRFGTRYRDPIVRAPNVHLYTHANVVELMPNEAMTQVESLRVKTITGKEHRVHAKQYVLACCSIQNARLLLASTSRTPAGLGNQNDLVGRYFMEHLEMPSGQLALAGRTPRDMKMYLNDFGKTKARGEIALAAAMQREHGILNATVSLTPGSYHGEERSTFQSVPPRAVGGMRAPERSDEDTAAPPSTPDNVRYFDLLTRQEQAPNPSSRVTLSRERDALGMPRARLDWRLTDLDRGSFRKFYEVLGRELGRAGIGHLRMHDWVMQGGGWPNSIGGGWHHMGTTRMSADPKHGVVDAQCRVYGLANLSVAGASVYATAACVNPTLTLVALSHRVSAGLRSASTTSA